MFIVSLHRDSKKGRARNSNVKGANEVRTKMNLKRQDYESRIDNTNREPKRHT